MCGCRGSRNRTDAQTSAQTVPATTETPLSPETLNHPQRTDRPIVASGTAR